VVQIGLLTWLHTAEPSTDIQRRLGSLLAGALALSMCLARPGPTHVALTPAASIIDSLPGLFALDP
jgi:hypothetical protein